nr:uncharacterized protein LOC131782572 isoform X1 [Pocillopora verrucosa]
MSNTVEPGLAKSTGIISVAAGVCGFGNCICGFIWLGYKGYGGHGLWSGFGLLLAAAMGLFIWRYRNKGIMVAFLVTCIILVIVVGIQTIIAALGYILWRLFRDATECYTDAGRCHCRATDGQRIPMDLETCDPITAIDSLFLSMTIFSAFGTVISLAGSVLGCMGTCCARTQQPGAVVVVQQPSGTQSTVVYTAPQYTGEGYPVQYPMAQPGQYPAQNAAAPMGHYPPPQYSATALGGVQHGAEAIPPKA